MNNAFNLSDVRLSVNCQSLLLQAVNAMMFKVAKQ